MLTGITEGKKPARHIGEGNLWNSFIIFINLLFFVSLFNRILLLLLYLILISILIMNLLAMYRSLYKKYNCFCNLVFRGLVGFSICDLGFRLIKQDYQVSPQLYLLYLMYTLNLLLHYVYLKM